MSFFWDMLIGFVLSFSSLVQDREGGAWQGLDWIGLDWIGLDWILGMLGIGVGVRFYATQPITLQNGTFLAAEEFSSRYRWRMFGG